MDLIARIIDRLAEASAHIEMGVITPVVLIIGGAAGTLWVARRKKADRV